MELFSFIFEIDKHLSSVIDLFGPWVYVILFAIIFAETGLVMTPFLPGDSLLFAIGTFAGAGLINFWQIYVILLIAAILGDTVNYWIGHYFGQKAFANANARFFKRSYLDKTVLFYEKHGGKTIILARFMPIIRTFAPFVAGVGKMNYKTFVIYNIVGAFLWVTLLMLAGYFFGGLAIVKQNFEYVIIGIIFVSFLPMFVEYFKHKTGSKIDKV